jgi:hypothetical protein
MAHEGQPSATSDVRCVRPGRAVRHPHITPLFGLIGEKIEVYLFKSPPSRNYA